MKYDYRCKTCLNEFEFEVVSTSKPKKCPNCGEKDKKKLVKLIRPTAVIYKGDGFTKKA